AEPGSAVASATLTAVVTTGAKPVLGEVVDAASTATNAGAAAAKRLSADVVPIAKVALQLALVLLAIHEFRVESPPFLRLGILATMFMFRLIVYLYDLPGDESPSIWKTLSYFFLLPNVCFTLFPVIDYTTFGRTYYDEDQHRIHQRGVYWMAMGVLHLLAYRV